VVFLVLSNSCNNSMDIGLNRGRRSSMNYLILIGLLILAIGLIWIENN
jgi:hypothetical protein